MHLKMTAIIGCLAVVALPALGREAKVHKPVPHGARGTAHHAPVKGPPPQKSVPADIAKAYAAMPEADRLAIQSDLAWTGFYQGPPGGDFDGHMIEAVKAFQKANGGKETGILSDPERARLATAATQPQQAAGWHFVDDPASGARFAVPAKVVSPAGLSHTGSRWSSGRGQIQIESFRFYEAGLPALFAAEKTTPHGRVIEWSALKPDSFVIAGMQGLKKFVVRAVASGREVRGITVLYDQATEGIMAPVAIAMSNTFQGFPDPNAVLPPGLQRTVQYGTAVVADQIGDLVTSAQVAAGCSIITVPGYGHAARIAEDKTTGLALLRLYGARDLVAAPLGSENAGGDSVTLVGVAGPQAQDDRDAITKLVAHLNGRDIEPAPGPSFSGALAIDAQDRFAGIVDLKPPVVAGPGPAALQAALVPADIVRAFLAAHGIAPARTNGPADRSVVRVICVRE
jgi:hypothetical protein